MTDADEHRSRPGFVYGVAIHSSRQEEGTPPCACPCHLADTPDGAQGWMCDKCFSYQMSCSYPEVEPTEYSHEQAIIDGTASPRPWMVMVPDYWFITKGNTLDDELGEHFNSAKAAEDRVRELNEADAIKSLRIPRTHRERFDRYRALHNGQFGWGDGEHHPATSLPRKPGRYAIEMTYDGSSYWATEETLDEVREAVLSGDTCRIVDLDTGEDVPFVLRAEIGAEV